MEKIEFDGIRKPYRVEEFSKDTYEVFLASETKTIQEWKKWFKGYVGTHGISVTSETFIMLFDNRLVSLKKINDQIYQGYEYFICPQYYDIRKDGDYYEGFILIGEYENHYSIYEGENPVFSGFVCPDGNEGSKSEELNKLDFTEIIIKRHKKD